MQGALGVVLVCMALQVGQAGHCCLCWLGQVVVLVPAQLSHCTAGLVAGQLWLYRHNCITALLGWWLGGCGCTGTTVSLLGWWLVAGGTGRTASWCCTAAGGVASGTLSFSCFKTQLLLFHLVFQMLVVTDKMQMILLHSLFQILYIHYFSNWLQVFEKLKCK